MTRLVSFLVCAGAAVLALLVLSPPAGGQGQGGPSGDITSVTAGSGMLGGGTRGAVTVAGDKTYFQRRFTAACGGGSAVQSVDVDGVPTCIAAGGGGEVVQSVATTGTINDLSVNADTTVLKFTGASSVAVTGLAVSGGNTDGRTIKVDNSTTGGSLSFSHNNGGSSAGNKVFTQDASPQSMPDNGIAWLVYSGTDSAWHLSTREYSAGTGLATSGTAFSLSMAGASCSAGNFVSALSATGTGTCTAETGDVSSWAANGNSLSVGGVAGATCSSGACSVNLSDRDFGPITTSTNGTVWTLDPSSVVSSNLNITTTSCSAGQHVSAISAGGVGTCTADSGGVTGSGTTNTLAIWTSSGAIGDSTITKSGSTYTASGTFNASGTVTGGTGVFNGAFDAGISTYGLAFKLATNSTAIGYINAVGYNEGTTQFRDLKIQNGKGADIATFDGTTKSVTFVSDVSVGNAATINGNVTIGNGNSAKLIDTGTLPTISSCNSGTRTGGQWSFTITPGSGTACTATFASACSNAPTCSVTPGYSPTSVVPYISSVSTSAVVLGATGTGWSGSQAVHVVCICH